MSYQTLYSPFPSTITVEENTSTTALSADLQQAIADCWRHQQERCGPQLFDGQLFNVTNYSAEKLSGSFIPYSWYIAWMHDPFVRKELPLAPMGISGITYAADDRVLIGKRSLTVASFPGAYEFVPSGGVDPSCNRGGVLELQELLYRELHEEVGIGIDQIVAFKPLALVRHIETGGIEACASLEVTAEALDRAVANPEEYSELHRLHIHDVAAFLESQGSDHIVDLSLYLWSHSYS